MTKIHIDYLCLNTSLPTTQILLLHNIVSLWVDVCMCHWVNVNIIANTARMLLIKQFSTKIRQCIEWVFQDFIVLINTLLDKRTRQLDRCSTLIVVWYYAFLNTVIQTLIPKFIFVNTISQFSDDHRNIFKSFSESRRTAVLASSIPLHPLSFHIFYLSLYFNGMNGI